MIKTVNLGKNFFSPKVETVGSIRDFLEASPTKVTGKLVTLGTLSTMGLTILSQGSTVQAADLGLRIMNAFDPITQLIQGLSYPVGFVMICAGCLVIMTGNRQKGMHIIKWAAIGYLLMVFAPGIMQILVEVGKAMTTK